MISRSCKSIAALFLGISSQFKQEEQKNLRGVASHLLAYDDVHPLNGSVLSVLPFAVFKQGALKVQEGSLHTEHNSSHANGFNEKRLRQKDLYLLMVKLERNSAHPCSEPNFLCVSQTLWH